MITNTTVDHLTPQYLRLAINECDERALNAASTWAAELLLAIPASKRNPINRSGQNSSFSTSTPARKRSLPDMSFTEDSLIITQPTTQPFDNTIQLGRNLSPLNFIEAGERDALATARICFESKEFLRVKSILSGCTSPKARFLSIYSRLLALEPTANLDWQTFDLTRKPHSEPVKMVLHSLLDLISNDDEPFLLFLKSVLLAQLSMREECIEACLMSLAAFPWNWATWSLLASCVGDSEELTALLPLLPLPVEHPLVQMFQVKTANDLDNPSEHEVGLCDRLLSPNYFPGSLWIMELRACALHHLRGLSVLWLLRLVLTSHVVEDHDQAGTQFAKLLNLDPYKIENVDIYANVLFLTGQRTKLTRLGLDLLALEKDRPEVCYLIGNHYASKADHAAAIKFFKRTTQLDPTHIQAWTLLGHEYVETKNSHAAIEAYRRAVDINRKDYRAWYGLGQAYELLNMHQYALHYYHYCTALRPYDVRLWQGLGMCYEEMRYLREAIECYKRALIPAGPDEIILNQALARIYRNLGEHAEAVGYHRRIVEVCQADERHIAEYAKSSLEVAEYELNSGGNLQLARELLQRVAKSNVEEVVRATDMLKSVNQAMRIQHRPSDGNDSQQIVSNKARS
ncbi:TPR-like protein [Dendrothele bispora CBS 962.96]|uniref:TPR-like protein n=1 Tax=Dendrothele bispora (strain CBS 962.96) TaxID=1314807 RepID=A0A4S8M205_DENBC|nr:TPR-like protein [Dendrothele bispora CBS 962.96]